MILNNMKHLTLLLFISTFIFACKKNNTQPAPIADFTFSGDTKAPAVITFTNKSTNAFSYSWDFGDNATSSETNPVHTYTKGGTYIITLKATGNGGITTTTKAFNVSSPTSVKITQVKVVQIPFVDANGYGWDAFTDGTGPDVFFKITDVNDGELYNHPTFYPNVSANNLPLSFTLTSPFQSTNFNTFYKLKVYDYDYSSSDELMGGYTFQFNFFANIGYPSSITLYTNGSSIKIDLMLQWQ